MCLPELGDLVMQGWSSYLRELKSKNIEEERQLYLDSLHLLIKANVVLRGIGVPAPEQTELTLNTMKLKGVPLRIKEVERHDVEVASNPSQVHFVFLVHGYGATSSATRQLEVTLRYLYPTLIVINSVVNEDKTEEDIKDMGQRLAREVENAIRDNNCGSNYNMSFVSHSLGGLIVRAALPFLEQMRYNMRGYISLGTPHLGHLFHNSTINKLGMWTLAKIKKSEVMAALLLESKDGDYYSSYLYELSSLSGLNWFEQVALYGCPGDKFVSPESALCLSSVEIETLKGKGNKEACIWEEMRKNISSLLRGVSVAKYEVDFSR